ncbi:MAG: extracellular solute-binding protein [Anaerolineae bacterium]
MFEHALSRRKFLGVAAAASAATVLAACQPQVVEVEKEVTRVVEQEVVKEVEKVVKETVVVTETVEAQPAYQQEEITVLICCSGGLESDLRDAFAEKFAQTYSGATARHEYMPAGQNYFEKLQTVIAAGTAPDIFDMWEGYVQPYAENGAMINMDPFFEADSMVSKDDLVPAAVEGGGWQGGIYAFCIGFMPGPISLYFNTNHFDEVGIPYPTSDWTWDNMREAAQALMVDSNSDGLPERWGLVWDNWFVPWTYYTWSNGGEVFNEDDTKCLINQPEAVEALQYWADLVMKDKVAVSGAEMSALGGSGTAFRAGAVSMFLGNCWDVPALTDAAAENPEFVWKAALSPKANNGGRVWYEHFWCWSISEQSKKRDTAWLYARDFVLDRVIEPATKTVPSLKQLLHTFATPENRELGYEPLITLATQPDLLRIPGSGAKWDKISGIIQAELDLVYIGEKSAQDAMDTAVPDVDAELARES